MSAEDIIAEKLLPSWPKPLAQATAQETLDAIEEAGFMLLPPDAAERLARWMAEDHLDPSDREEYSWELADEAWRNSWRRKATKALAAVKEPSAKLDEAGPAANTPVPD